MPLSACTVNPEFFARILFSRIALKDKFAIENFAIMYDLPLSIIDRVISSFREVLSSDMRSFAKIKPSQISEFTVYFIFTNDEDSVETVRMRRLA